MAEKIKITFLGTGSAVPTARRNHPATLLQFAGENFLFDCGEGTQRQFRLAGLNPCKISKIFISHWHGDHVLGLPGLLQTLMLNGYNRKLEIYGPKGSKQRMRTYLDLFAHKGDELDLEVFEVSEGVVFEGEDFVIECGKAEHDCPAVAYSFSVKEKTRLDREKLAKLKLPNGPLIGELVKGKSVEIGGKKIDGKKLVYVEPARKVSIVMDTRFCDDLVKFAKCSDVLICESTYSKEESEVADEHSHLTSHDAANLANKSKSKALVLVHMSQRYSEIPKVILNEAKEVFENTIVVEDLDELVL